MSQKARSTFVLTNPTEILHALVGLKGVRVVHYERSGAEVELAIEQVLGDVRCPSCSRTAQVKDRPLAHYIDLPVYGAPMRLAWKKHRMRCVNATCSRRTWVLRDHRIAAKHCLLTTRAAKWATVQVGTGRTVKEVAAELACDWHTVNDAVTTYGKALLEADRKRLNKTTAIGLDETSLVRAARSSHPDFVTTVADVENHQIIDILPTRKYEDVAAWISSPKAGRNASASGPSTCRPPTPSTRSCCPGPTRWSTPSTPSPWPTAPSTPSAGGSRSNSWAIGPTRRSALSDPASSLDGRREAQGRGHRTPLSLLELGDPGAEVAIAYRVKERLRDFYATNDPDEARQMLEELQTHCLKGTMPPEIQKLGRTIRTWFDKLANFHLARVSNGPTESLNNLIKRIKRIGFGFRNFENYQIRALLYAGRPNWRVLGSIVVR